MEYKVLVNGNGEYKVQKLVTEVLRVLWWESKTEYWEDCVRYEFPTDKDGKPYYTHPLRLVTFKSKSEACEWIQKEQERERKEKLGREWKEAGPC